MQLWTITGKNPKFFNIEPSTTNVYLRISTLTDVETAALSQFEDEVSPMIKSAWLHYQITMTANNSLQMIAINKAFELGTLRTSVQG